MSDFVTALVLGGFNGEALEDWPSGAPLYVHRVNGKLGLAVASSLERATFVGVAANPNAAGFVGHVDDEIHGLDDWTDVIGAPLLTKGLTYYVDTTPGRLTSIAPASAGLFVAAVGVAVSTTMLKVNVQPPILL